MKKGVSPVIATVLLVSLVIVIALAIFLWLRGTVQDSTLKFGKDISQLCDEVDFEAEIISEKLSVVNNGNTPIYNFNLKISTNNLNFMTESVSDVVVGWTDLGLKQGQSFNGGIDVSILSDVAEIEISPVLLGESSRPSSHEAYDCGDNYAKVISIK